MRCGRERIVVLAYMTEVAASAPTVLTIATSRAVSRPAGSGRSRRRVRAIVAESRLPSRTALPISPRVRVNCQTWALISVNAAATGCFQDDGGGGELSARSAG